MTYTVVWKPSAEEELARLWMQTAERSAVEQAANRIDDLLRVDPGQRGTPHLGPTRTLMVPPLGVIFRVYDADRLVRVLAVWYIAPHTTNGFP